MYSKKGQPFRCSLPEVPKSVEEGDPLKDVTTEKIKYVLKNADEAKPSLCLRWVRPLVAAQSLHEDGSHDSLVFL